MASLLKRWKRAGYTRADVQGMYYAGQVMNARLGPRMTQTLRRYGLTDLTNWVKTKMVYGSSEEEILFELYDQPAFVKRFPAIKARQKANLPPISVDDYLSYEQAAQELTRVWGFDISKTQVDALLTKGVSAQELEGRVNIAASAVFEAAPETRTELRRLFNAGISGGDVMKYWMDPKRTMGELQQKYRMGEIAGAALRTGYGQVDLSVAEQLAGAGLDEGAAIEGFSTLARMRNLFQPIHGGESVISQQEQVDFLAGDVDAARDVERRVRQRLATFRGRGGFGVGGEGFTTGVAGSGGPTSPTST